MQSKFTRKKTWQVLRLMPLLMLFCFLGSGAKAQVITITTETDPTYNGLNTFGPVNSAITFVINNTNGFPVVLKGVDCYLDPGTIGASSTTPTLWYSTTSLGGAPTVAGPTWTALSTGAVVNFPSAGYYNMLSGLSYSIPANSMVRFALQSTGGLSYSGGGTGVPAISSFTSNGVFLLNGPQLGGGLTIGYAGGFPSPANNPRHFQGRITVDVSSAPCSGTPAPGNTLSSVPTVCPSVNFTLSVQTPPAGSGVSYQWEFSNSASGPWTGFGTNSSTQVRQQTAATYYRAIVTCGANSGTSTPIQVLLTPPSGCYCIPTYANGCGLGDEIANVTLATLNNTSACSATPYTYYSAVAAPVLVQGGTYPVSVKVGPDGVGQFVRIWADWNQDGDFADAGEDVGVSGNVGSGGTAVINMTVPVTATLGTTRMRVRGGDDVASLATQSCGATNSAYGEAEDYNISITPCIQGQFTTGPANVSIQCSNNASFTVTTVGSALNYSWEYKVSAASPFWLPITNTGVYSGATTSTLTLTNVPSTMNGYVYRAVIQGPCTGVDVSSAATLTVNPLVATVNPTSATICTGSIQALSLTNASSPTTVSFSNNTPLPIPDASGAGVYSTIAVAGIPAGAVVTNVSVKLNIPNHTYVGDLEINLIAPNNVSLNLIGELDNGTGSNSSDGFVNTVVSSTSTTPMSGAPAPRTGTYAGDRLSGYGPSGNFQTNPNGMPWSLLYTILNGNWRLGLSDWFGGDTGTLTDWTLTITYGAPAAGIWTSSPAAPNTMFTDPAATVPYVAGTPVTTIYVNPTVNTNYSVVYSTATPCTSAPTVIPVTVVNPVTAVVNPVNTAACVGTNATFTVSAGGGPLAYQWQVSTDALTWNNITGATSSTLTVPNVTQAMNGYRYRAVVSAPPCGGSTNSGPATLTVNALPVVAITAPDLSITPGPTTTITGTTSPAAAAGGWSWTLNGSAIPGTTNTQVVGIDGLGTYRARVVDVNGCVGFSNNLLIEAEATDRLWIYPNPSAGDFQVRLYYGGPVTERRVVRIYKTNGQLVMEKEFTLDNVVSPYLRMDFDLNHLAAGTYVVKVDNTVTGKITSGLVVIQHD